MNFNITKSDYVLSLQCDKNFWLYKHKPELFDNGQFSEFTLHLQEEGKIVDEASRNLFIDAIFIDARGQQAIEQTQKELESSGVSVLLQPAFASDVFFAQCDVLKIIDHDNKQCELYEVKASTGDKKEHIPDLSFQKKVLENNGFKVCSTGIIHLNPNYRRNGTLDYSRLFTTTDVTDKVNMIEQQTIERMNYLKEYINSPEPQGCLCIYKGRSAHCDTFAYSNPTVPDYSIHDLNRIGLSKKLLQNWAGEGIYKLEEIPEPNKLTTPRKLQYDSYMSRLPVIDTKSIKETLGKLLFPIHFFDYEACSFAIPQFDGFRPYQFVTFQYSLHLLYQNGELEHKEFLITHPQQQISLGLVAQMIQDFHNEGSVVVWHKTFEIGRNKELAELYPEYQDFFDVLNNQRVFDLEDIFSKNMYVDARSKGSSSLKEILPIIVPDLTYKTLGIQGGTAAMTEWSKLIFPDLPPNHKEQIRTDLLEYCKLDSLAMVEIYRALLELIA